MEQFKTSPRIDYPIIKYILLLCGIGGFVAVSAGIYESIANHESILGAIILVFMFLMILIAVLIFWNYSIVITTEEIIETNWIGRKKTVLLSDLSKHIFVYYWYNQMYVIFYNKNNKRILKTKYGKLPYLNFLYQHGFTLDKKNTL